MQVILLTSGPNAEGLSATSYRSIGAYKIANSCRQAGYSAQVVDHIIYFTEDELVSSMTRFIDNDTIAIGISTTFIAVNNSYIPDPILNALATIKKNFPKIKFIFGGYGHLAVKLNQKIKPDALIYDYGEDTFVELLNFYSGKGQEPQSNIEYLLKQNDGIRKSFKSYKTPKVPKFNIETDYFRFVEQDMILPNETLPIEISRGCIFKCKFCNHLLLGRGKLDYLKDMELVKNELMYNYEKFGTTNYYVICDTFNDTETKMKYWYDMVKSLPFKIQYTVYLRADLLHRFPDVPYMLAETGLFSAFHGIESFNNTAAVTIGKGWSAKHGKEFLPELYHNIWKGQVFQTLSFIAGLPGDTKQDNYEVVDWFVGNDMYHISIHPLGLVANKLAKNASEFERNVEKYGYRFVNPNTPDANGLGKFGYWENDIWNQREVAHFISNEILPKLMPASARHGSWAIMQLLQYGYTHDSFLKENRNKFSVDTIKQQTTNWINLYKSKILGTEVIQLDNKAF